MSKNIDGVNRELQIIKDTFEQRAKSRWQSAELKVACAVVALLIEEEMEKRRRAGLR